MRCDINLAIIGCIDRDNCRELFIVQKFLTAATFLTAIFIANPTFAGTTGWIDLENRKAVKAALDIAEKNMGPQESYKRVKCKYEDGKLLIKVDYNIIGHSGFFGVMTGMKEEIDAHFQQPREKKLKSRIRSRSDVEFKNGVVSCVIWFRPL